MLTCKQAPMSGRDQRDLLDVTYGEDMSHLIVASKDECAWKIDGPDFETMSVTPSIDASAAGHWHGHITGGMIV